MKGSRRLPYISGFLLLLNHSASPRTFLWEKHTLCGLLSHVHIAQPVPIFVSFANFVSTVTSSACTSNLLIKTKNNTGSNTEPCGTHHMPPSGRFSVQLPACGSISYLSLYIPPHSMHFKFHQEFFFWVPYRRPLLRQGRSRSLESPPSKRRQLFPGPGTPPPLGGGG